jgi:D-tyrosyl-tRNA(Tyr) deacylase
MGMVYPAAGGAAHWSAVRAVVQRVLSASVAVGGEVVGRIGPGLCAFVGVTHGDTPAVARRLADKLCGLRVFGDDDGVMNRSVVDIGGNVLVVSQFTVYGDTSRGRRPSWSAAAPPEVAEPLVDAVVEQVRLRDVAVATGRFRADMVVTLAHDGPVTLLLDVP